MLWCGGLSEPAADLVCCHRYGFQPVLDYGFQLLDAVEVRGLSVLFLLVVDFVAIYEDLQNAGHAGLDLYGYCISAYTYELIDHPGRNTVILSRYAIDNLDVHLAFASHSISSSSACPMLNAVLVAPRRVITATAFMTPD